MRSDQLQLFPLETNVDLENNNRMIFLGQKIKTAFLIGVLAF